LDGIRPVRDAVAAPDKEPQPPRPAVPATGKPRGYGPEAGTLSPQPQT
jgi:hypothetical protein